MKILLEGFETRYEEDEGESASSRVGRWKSSCLRNISQIRGKCSELKESAGHESTEKYTHCLVSGEERKGKRGCLKSNN